jgi:hypothetical protein
MPGKPGHARLSGEHYTHRYVWAAAETLRERGREDLDGNAVLIIASALFVYFAVEGYANDAGVRLFPDIWEREREFFAGDQFQGTLGKLEFLATELGVAVDKGRRPWQTLKTLEAHRHRLVHARTQMIDREVRFLHPRQLEAADADFYALADEDFLDRAVNDAESLCDALQAAARAKFGNRRVPLPRAFRGMLGQQGGSIDESPS